MFNKTPLSNMIGSFIFVENKEEHYFEGIL